MLHRAFLIHCLSPLHAGTGQSVGLIDLPIARYKASLIPYLPGSSIKGVVRDHATPPVAAPQDRRQLDTHTAWSEFIAAFGPDVDKDNASEHAGAVSFGDARLLAMPIRSLRGTFAYVTSPLLLRLARQDLAAAGVQGAPQQVPSVPGAINGVPRLLVPDPTPSVLVHPPRVQGGGARAFLEELDFNVQTDATTEAWAEWLGRRLFPAGPDDLKERFAVIGDEQMTFFFEMATQVDAHNRINDQGVVAQGQLWYQENLPAESILIGYASATPSRRKGRQATDQDMLDLVLPAAGHPFLQFGGKATTGKGRARLLVV